LNIPYTGSGKLASRLAIDKIASRNIFELHGLTVPRYKILTKLSYNKNRFIGNNLKFPLVVKPATQGSSIGLSIIDQESALDNALNLAFTLDEKIIIEEYVRGREVTVGILGNRALPVIEIIPKKRFFDFEAKYQAGLTEYVVPAKLEKGLAKKIQSQAYKAHKLLGCLGCSRVDIILSDDNIPYILEINSIPGLTATSLLPKAAKNAGIEFEELCVRLIRLAYGKTKD
jgi:D-alanine--D-alanine ligase